MSTKAVTAFLNEQADALMVGDVASIAARFTTPIPVYLNESLMVLGSPAIAEEALGIMRAGLLAHGVAKQRARVIASELPRGPMQKVWIDWTYLNSAGALLGKGRTEYVLRDPGAPERTMFELIDHVSLAFPDIKRNLPVSR
ncbi:MAG: hypothetical protein AAGM84_07685 [Pseudomonadota bacterium]